MAESKNRVGKTAKDDAEEVKEILSVVSTEVPTLIKNIIATVFSEDAGRNMGKAAAAFYKELKESGMPDEVALRMTEDYMKTFTGFGDLLKQSIGKESVQIHTKPKPHSKEEE
ncbi:MAG: hypothetical protein JSV05_04290 [Candidatus Bathyarchaeota archaeon]|nr:MAG: hypothetical protein JSV05_04290 [Candidatus Bathyarchaeota archaeon]